MTTDSIIPFFVHKYVIGFKGSQEFFVLSCKLTQFFEVVQDDPATPIYKNETKSIMVGPTHPILLEIKQNLMSWTIIMKFILKTSSFRIVFSSGMDYSKEKTINLDYISFE